MTDRFIKDYTSAKGSPRYVEGTLPKLPFSDHTFELVLCPHFLFLNADRFTEDFQTRSIVEMLRVAPEIRVFPIIQLDLKRPLFLGELISNQRDKHL